MRLIPIGCVRPDTYLAKTIYDHEGKPLLKAGALLTKRVIKKLREINIYSIYVIDEYSSSEIQDIIKPELRQKSIKKVHDSFMNLEKLYLEPYLCASSYKRNEILKKQDSIIKELYNVAYELLDNILSNKNVLVNLVDIKTMDNYTYQHSVNVAVLSIVIGMGLKLNKSRLLDLALGALLHDIGKIFVPKEILLKPGKLTPEEYDEIKKHPKRGYEYVSKFSFISSVSKIIILEHHEKYDGTGYPDGISADQINLLANVVSIADVYDALTSDRPYKKPMCPNDAFEYILGNADKMFRFDIVNIFSKVIVPYPEGTMVKLSNGDIAIVQGTPCDYPLRPIVKVIKSEEKEKEGSIIDLAESLSLVISNIEYNLA